MRIYLALIATLLAVTYAAAISSFGKPLYEYVADTSEFSWSDTGVTVSGDGYTGYLLSLTSGRWHNESYVTPSLWKHDLLVIVPDNIKDKDNGLMFVAEGCNDCSPYDGAEAKKIIAIDLALTTSAIAAVLYQVPSQPSVYANDPTGRRRSEDALVAYSWAEAARYHDPSLTAYFPMARAAVRAMDAVTAFTAGLWGSAGVQGFVVGGASKRGATSWLAGAADRSQPKEQWRVLGIVPIVFDMLNLADSIKHMFRAYGNWTFALHDYIDAGVTELIDTPGMDYLSTVVDPLAYRDELNKVPRLVMSGTGDEFFMPDDDWYWWDAMSGDNIRLHVANAEHTMITGLETVLKAAKGFLSAVYKRKPLALIKSQLTAGADTGLLHAWSATRPSKATLFYALTTKTTPSRRDFRMIRKAVPGTPCDVRVDDDLCLNPVVWANRPIDIVEQDGGWAAWTTQADPGDGLFLGAFIEFQFPGIDGSSEQVATSQVLIVPNTFPFDDCEGVDECRGGVV